MKAELHCHSNIRDGIPSVKEIVKKAETMLDVLALTDHNTMSGYLRAKKLAKNVLIIPSEEVSSLDGHILAFNIQETVKPKRSALEIIDDIHTQGGIAIAAHPYGELFRRGITNVQILKKIDAVETVNGLCISWQNGKAARLAEKLKKPKVSGSDAHILKDVGKFACEINGTDIDSLMNSIKKGRVKIINENTSLFGVVATKLTRKFYTKIRDFKNTEELL